MTSEDDPDTEGSQVFETVALSKSSVWPGETVTFKCVISNDIFLSDYNFFLQWPYGMWSTGIDVDFSNVYG